MADFYTFFNTFDPPFSVPAGAEGCRLAADGSADAFRGGSVPRGRVTDSAL